MRITHVLSSTSIMRKRVVLWLSLGVLLVVPAWIGAKIVKTSHSNLWVPTYLKAMAGRAIRHQSRITAFLFF